MQLMLDFIQKRASDDDFETLAGREWWAQRDSNPQPRDYESPALTVAP